MPVRRTNIGYADYAGADLGFVIGCTKVSEGCRFCWAEAWAKRSGRDFSKVRVYPEKLARLCTAKFEEKGKPFRRGPGSRPLAFAVDMGDLFHEAIPVEFIIEAFEVMRKRTDVDWLILTKRAERMDSILFGEEGGYWLGGGDYWRNIWPGISAENQKTLDARIPALLGYGGITVLSLEPLLEPVRIPDNWPYGRGFVIVGAESGPNRRPFRKEWAWDILDQCREAGVPCFLKQASGSHPGVPLLDKEGGEVKEWPK